MPDIYLWDRAEIRRRLRTGLVTGAAIGGLATAVGLIRLADALLSGHHFDPVPLHDLLWLVLYVGAFTVAGGVLGACWPLRHSFLGRFLLGYAGAGIVVAACGLIVIQLDHDYHDLMSNVVIWLVVTLVWGTLVGHWIRPDN